MAHSAIALPTKANIKTSWKLFQSTIIATIKFKTEKMAWLIGAYL